MLLIAVLLLPILVHVPCLNECALFIYQKTVSDIGIDIFKDHDFRVYKDSKVDKERKTNTLMGQSWYFLCVFMMKCKM